MPEIRPPPPCPSCGAEPMADLAVRDVLEEHDAAENPTADPRDWTHMDEAPRDGTLIQVFVPAKHRLPGFISDCAWHPDAGFCVDELREPTAWRRQ